MSRDFTEIEDYPFSVTEAKSANFRSEDGRDPVLDFSNLSGPKTGFSPCLHGRPKTFEKVRVRVGLLMTRHTVLLTVNSVTTFR